MNPYNPNQLSELYEAYANASLLYRDDPELRQKFIDAKTKFEKAIVDHETKEAELLDNLTFVIDEIKKGPGFNLVTMLYTLRALIRKIQGGTAAKNIERLKKAFLHGDQIVPRDGTHMSFEWGIQNAEGAWFILLRERHHTDDDVQRAKAILRNTRDVVDLTVEWVD